MKTKTMAQTAIALTIACIIAVMVVLGIFGNSQCWFGHKYDEAGVCVRCGDAKEIKPEEDKPLANGGMAISDISNGRNMRLAVKRAAQTASGENTYDLTATITPATADNKNVTWAVAWKNANSTFAKGKNVTDYVTVAAAADNQLKATVTCKQAFGEQVIVKVTSEENAAVNASCTVDYVEKVTGVNLTVAPFVYEGAEVTYTFDTTVYTIKAELKLSLDKQVELTPDFQTVLSEKINALGFTSSDYCLCPANVTDYVLEGNIMSLNINIPQSFKDACDTNAVSLDPNSIIGCFVAVDEMMSDADRANIKAAFVDALSAYKTEYGSDLPTFCGVSFSSTYNGKTYSSGTTSVGLKFDGSSIHIPVGKMTLSDGSIIF